METRAMELKNVETELLIALGRLGVAQEQHAPPGELDTLATSVRSALDHLGQLKDAA